MPPLQVVLFGLPGALQLVILLFVPAFILVVRRKWRLSTARREEIRRLVLLASEEAARVEIEAAYEYRNRLEHEYSLSSAATPGPIAKPVCTVCYSPTTTRCARCKAVRYCSGKCQIIHWRQGHKEECHPPHIDIHSDMQKNSSDPKTHQIEGSNLCDGSFVDLDANSNERANKERPVSSSSSYSSTTLSKEDNLQAKHIMETSGTRCSSDSSSLLPSSSYSAFTVPMEDGDFTHDSSIQDNSTRCQENSATADVSHASTSEVCERGPNKPLPSRCIGAKSSESNASIGNLNDTASDCNMGEAGCQSGSSLGPSFGDMDDCVISKSTVDQTELEGPVFESSAGQCSDCTVSIKSEVSTEKVVLHQQSGPALQFSTNSSCQAVASCATVSNRMPFYRDVQFRDRDPSTVRFDISDSGYSRSDNSDLQPKPRQTASVVIASSDDQKSSDSRGYSVSTATFLKGVNGLAVHARSSGVTSSTSNGSYDLKTSVQRVVQQFKSSKTSRNIPWAHGTWSTGKNNHKILFPYDIFVKLYNEKVDMRPSGLINCGNSCYANVVLQCLAFTRPLTSYLLQGLHTESCLKKDWCFTCEFESLVLKAKKGQSPLSPVSIISQISNIGSHLGHGRQEDAHEFLRYAIDAMQSVCLKEGGKDPAVRFAGESTLIKLMFGGYLRSKIKCMKCQNKSERNERMMDLTVEIHGDVGTLEEALAQFTRTEVLDGENKYQCNRCKSYEKAKKRLKVLEAPNILTIALKRFQSGKFGKLNKAVRFPEFLNLAKYMTGTGDKSPIYRLYAVVVHLDIMNAAFSGHYVCYVMNANGKWYKVDDSTVKPVELERVLSKTAYMLFYARCSPRAPTLIRSTMDHDDGKIKRKCQDALSSAACHRQQNHLNWTNGSPARTSAWDSCDASDSSSLLSCSDEGSCNTESTRDSTSTDGFSEYFFGESGYCNSPMSYSADSESFSSSPSFAGNSPEVILNDDLLESHKSGYSHSSQENSCLMRSLSYRDSLEEVGTAGMMLVKGKDGVSCLRSDTNRNFRELTECASRSRDSDLANPFDCESVWSMRSTRDRATQTFH